MARRVEFESEALAVAGLGKYVEWKLFGYVILCNRIVEF